MKKFHAFCTTHQVMDPFPLTENLLCSFAVYMADQGLFPQTIKSYLAGLRNMQLSLGLPDPREQSSLPILRRVQAGISRTRLGTAPSRIRLPITPQLLRQIKHSLESTAHQERVVIWAICCVAFFGCFRLGELLLESPSNFEPRAWGDVAVDNQAAPSILQIHLKQSKTDQFGRGVDIVLGRTGKGLCPVAATLG